MLLVFRLQPYDFSIHKGYYAKFLKYKSLKKILSYIPILDMGCKIVIIESKNLLFFI